MGMDLKVLLEISMQNMEKIQLKDNSKKLMIQGIQFGIISNLGLNDFLNIYILKF